MYLDYFSLKRHPFRITPDPSLFFPGGSRGRGVVLDALVYGITSGEGILKVVGEVGSGKTMLCRMLEERLPDSIEIVYLANPSLSARDIVYAIAIELKLDVDAATDRLLVLHKLQEYLLRKHAEGGSVVVFIEEAQSMPLETLEEVRLLSNLETHRHKLMQIVLFGQPELDRKLEQREIRQLRERITHSFNLGPLGADEVREYLHFRLQAAGCPWPQLFSPKAELMLAKASGGLSRRINILADKALLAAYADPATRPDARNGDGERLPVVFPRHVRVAIADSSYRSLEPSPWRKWTGYALAALGGACAVGLALWLLRPDAVPAPNTMSAADTALAASEPGAASTSANTNTNTNTSAGPAAAVNEVEAGMASEAADPLDVPASFASADPNENGELASAEVPAAAGGSPSPEAAPVAAAQPLPDASPDTDLVDTAGTAAASVAPTSITPPPVEPAKPDAAGLAAAAGLQGLIRDRFIAAEPWLEGLAQKTGYSVQLFSVPTANSERLAEFLEFLVLYDMLEGSYLCRISGNSRRQEQWLVLHGEFAGLSEAREFIDDLPPYLRQHGPYARNIEGVACANDGI